MAHSHGHMLDHARQSCLALTLLLVLLTAGGCHRWQTSHRTAVEQFSTGQLEQSYDSLEKSQKSLRAEQNLLTLDAAIVHLASARPAEAETQLRTVRGELEHLAQADLTEQTTSVLTDDRAVAFSGRAFEQQMALNVLLLASLLNNGQDSFAYALQAAEVCHGRRQLLAEAAAKQQSPGTPGSGSPIVPAGFQQVSATPVLPGGSGHSGPHTIRLTPDPTDQTLAFASYLSAAVQSESPTRLQEAEASLMDLSLWNPQFAVHPRPSSPDPGPASGAGTGPSTVSAMGALCQPGNGTLHVIVFSGRAPEWVAETAAPTSASLLIADRILSVTGKHTLPPTIAPVKIARPQPIDGNPSPGLLHCRIGGAATAEQRGRETELTFRSLVDLNAVAEADYQQNRDEQIARAVTRRVVKKGAVYVVKEAQKIHRNTAVDLAVNVAGVAWEALEKPDTRSWKLLPARIDIASAELPEGTWQATLRCGGAISTSPPSAIPVRVVNGRNTWVVCFMPQRSLTGHILVGGADSGSFQAGQLITPLTGN